MPAEQEFILPVRANALKRAMTNLLTNACRHGDQVRLSVSGDSETVELTVEDDGPGIPVDRRADVLRPFVRLDSARSPHAGSTGLGLTIARSIAHEHGGDLHLADSPMGGLRAVIRLPV